MGDDQASQVIIIGVAIVVGHEVATCISVLLKGVTLALQIYILSLPALQVRWQPDRCSKNWIS
jgi:hypothetical protein